PLDFEGITDSIDAMIALGVPYDETYRETAPEIAREQAADISKRLLEEGGPEGLEDREVIAMIAYLMRLGTDLSKPVEVDAETVASVELGGGRTDANR
ncbi:MAG: hypothetical protein GY885_15790, partial [Phycisphaeraceae bacterium]|nr:hypothetical protein [Phycisphaeraceae bacterium]